MWAREPVNNHPVIHSRPPPTTGRIYRDFTIGLGGGDLAYRAQVEGVAIQRIRGWRFSGNNFGFPPGIVDNLASGAISNKAKNARVHDAESRGVAIQRMKQNTVYFQLVITD